jgi:hypothetical protein
VAVAVPGLTLAEHDPASLSAVMSAGALTAGFSVSLTVTVCTASAVRPEASVAVQVMVVVPFG